MDSLFSFLLGFLRRGDLGSRFTSVILESSYISFIIYNNRN
jgi:hypothetical protein